MDCDRQVGSTGLYFPAAILGDTRVSIRTATTRDLEPLIAHFGLLSQSSRHNRFMGAADNLSKIASECLVSGEPDRFLLVAELRKPDGHVIIGEASYAFDRREGRGEFAISVADRWQRRGLGVTLLAALQLRAVALGHCDLFGESLKTNVQMLVLAKKAGFAFSRSPDWRAIRFDKRLAC